MRARTRRLRSLLRGIVTSPLGTPRCSPQQRSMMTQRTDETNPGVCPPLPLRGLRLGRSLKRLGVDGRRQYDVAAGRRRQGAQTDGESWNARRCSRARIPPPDKERDCGGDQEYDEEEWNFLFD